MRLSLLLLFVLCTSFVQAETLAQASSRLAAEASQLKAALETGETSWGQGLALEDLTYLESSARELSQQLAESDALSLLPLVESLASARRRLTTSQVVAGQSLTEVVSLATAIEERVKACAYRFDGRAPLAGQELAATPMEGSLEPVEFNDPRELWREARNVWDLARRVGNRGFFRFQAGFGQPNNVWPQDLRRLTQSAYHFERETLRFEHVEQTRASYQRLRQAYDRLGVMPTTFATRQLERSFQRLDAFYESL